MATNTLPSGFGKTTCSGSVVDPAEGIKLALSCGAGPYHTSPSDPAPAYKGMISISGVYKGKPINIWQPIGSLFIPSTAPQFLVDADGKDVAVVSCDLLFTPLGGIPSRLEFGWHDENKIHCLVTSKATGETLLDLGSMPSPIALSSGNDSIIEPEETPAV